MNNGQLTMDNEQLEDMKMSDDREFQLRKLVEVFLEENKKLNLSAFRTEEKCWIGNVQDSLAALPFFEELEHAKGIEKKCIDIGTGGGFPLLALAICLPDWQFLGLDSVQKKIDAIGRIIQSLGLTNVDLVCGRTEELGRDPVHRETYDVVTARAIAELNVLLEYASPLVKPKGHILCWKSMNIDQELRDSLLARAELSCQLEGSHPYELPEQWGKRQLVLFSKRVKLSDTYPRSVGVPKKNPLI